MSKGIAALLVVLGMLTACSDPPAKPSPTPSAGGPRYAKVEGFCAKVDVTGMQKFVPSVGATKEDAKGVGDTMWLTCNYEGKQDFAGPSRTVMITVDAHVYRSPAGAKLAPSVAPTCALSTDPPATVPFEVGLMQAGAQLCRVETAGKPSIQYLVRAVDGNLVLSVDVTVFAAAQTVPTPEEAAPEVRKVAESAAAALRAA
jgi:hypothetical protein